MTIKDFELRKTGISSVNDEVKDSLTPFEVKLCQSFKRIELRGKQGRKVPLLLTREVENSIQLLNQHRKDVGVNLDNPLCLQC